MDGFFPVLLSVKNKRCLVVGGGQVGARKAASLHAAGAKVTVISPVLGADLLEAASRGEITHVKRKFEDRDLNRVFLVVAATDDTEVNTHIQRVAVNRNILANIADSPKASTFIVPSIIRRGDLIVAIATSSKSPALSRKLRMRLEKEIGQEYGELVNMVGEVRDEMKTSEIRIGEETWQKALDLEELISLIKSNRCEEAKSILKQRLISKGQGG